MGNKKNKRGSIITSSLSMTTKTELIERTPENDYGVLSDPEEGTEINEKVMAADIEDHPRQSQTLTDNSVPMSMSMSASVPQSSENETYLPQNTPPTQSLKRQQSPPSSPSLSPPLSSLSLQQAQLPSSLPSLSSPSTLTLSGRLTPSLPPPSPGAKSLKALQLKLTTDKNFSKKITLYNFFSYVVLAIEIVRASSASIAHISIDNVEKLVEYMIDNHTANKDIETYLNTLLKMGVIRNLISAVIEFNTDQADALDKLLSTEQMEMELISLKDAAEAASIVATAATTNDNQSQPTANTPPTPQLSQTPHQSRSKRLLNFLKLLFFGCCGGSAGGTVPQRR